MRKERRQTRNIASNPTHSTVSIARQGAGAGRGIEELYPIRSLHYEVLKGDKTGISSIRVNDQYRIEFTVKQVSAETVVTICNILELSNHYK